VLADVFTEQPLAGNQLVVVLNAQRLSDSQMQAIAREFNHSETTFVLPARQAKAAWRLRSFSPSAEVFGSFLSFINVFPAPASARPHAGNRSRSLGRLG
jgi:hypothetical protein